MTLNRHAITLSTRALLGAAGLLLPLLAAAQIAPLKYELTGDLGGAVYGTQSVIRSKGNETRLLPYGFFDYGRLAVRVDTLSLKTVKFGYGYLEFAGRVSQDGWRADTAALSGLKDRKTPIPLGIGTFQETPYGALFLNAFVDANKSHGSLLEATYAAEFKLGSWSFFPQLGLEYSNAKYNNYLYGVSAVESAASGFSVYNAGASTSPVLGLGVDVPLGEPWTLTMQVRRKWLDSSVRNSPLISRRTQDTGFIAVSYRFR
ncbi:MipA/OmpV family protein [Polaromonas sp. CT11-55]|uniref:MipA/OmpV family protein n=1 Tax=Polaromonas sp. CT11-55 TaxID=3243045 RepID=UPI0039A423E7